MPRRKPAHAGVPDVGQRVPKGTAIQPDITGLLPPHNNQHLFSDRFLNDRLPEQSDWQSLRPEAATTYERIRARYDDRALVLANESEAQLEDDFIKPILVLLGHSFEVQPFLRTPDGTHKPDYVFYRDQASVDAHKGKILTDVELKSGGLVVGDAKQWKRSLDAPLGPGEGTDDVFSNKNPSFQISFYIQHSGLDWGILTNGRLWRLYHRDSAHKLDRYYEVDLQDLIASGDIDRFLYFYAFFRRAAFDSSGGNLALNVILVESVRYARSVGDSLKEQVFQALRLLAQGFLGYPDNGLVADQETLANIYDNSLILLYRLLFALYAEARGLLPLRESELYRDTYSLQAIKTEVAERRDRGKELRPTTGTLWPRLRTLFQLIDKGDPPLNIATFNGGLFDPARHPFLEEKLVGDAALSRAIDLISRVDGEFVDYRDLAERHLGTIYEGLLEYHLAPMDVPEPAPGGGVFTVELLNDKGQRKSSGSFYTPDHVVQQIVRNNLEPVVAAALALAEDDAARAASLLRINVLDPAMGSGHFLVEATEYLARQLGTLNVTGKGEDGAAGGEIADVSYWKRRVVQSCIYGVDLNPLAVDLAKLSLWLVTAAKDRPLSFLDHHLRGGNSLVGGTIEELRAALAKVAKRKKRKKKSEDEHQMTLADEAGFRAQMGAAVGWMEQIEANSGRTVEDVKEQERAYNELRATLVGRYGKDLDLLTALSYGLDVDGDTRTSLLRFVGRTVGAPASLDAHYATAQRLAENHGFFHWQLEFPDVFFASDGASRGDASGFDVIIGNPPYEVIAAKERAGSTGDDAAFLGYAKRHRVLKGAIGGKVDLYRLFVMKALSLGRIGANAGFIVPLSLLADQFAAPLRRAIFDEHGFRSIDAFPQKDDPRRRVFPEAKLATCVVAFQCRASSGDGFPVTTHPGRVFEERTGVYACSHEIVKRRDAEMLTIPLFREQAGVTLDLKLRSGPGVCRMGELFQSNQGELNEKSQSRFFSPDPTVGPKILRGGNVQRYLFVPEAKQGDDLYLDLKSYEDAVGGDRITHTRKWRLGYQRNAALDSSRRLVFTRLPNPSYCFDSVSYIVVEDEPRWSEWLGMLNSDLHEWVFRQTSTNNHVSVDEVANLPAIRGGAGTAKIAAAKAGKAVRTLLSQFGEGASSTACDAILVGIREMLKPPKPQVTVPLGVLGRLAEFMLRVQSDRHLALARALTDLEGLLPAGQLSKTGRLFTPPSPPRTPGERSHRRYEEGRREAEAGLGALASVSLSVDDLGRLTEAQWKWLVRSRFGVVRNLADLVDYFRHHTATLRDLDTRIRNTDALMNSIVYALFRLDAAEVGLIEREVPRLR